MLTLAMMLILSAALFSIGLLAALSRRHAIFVLIGQERLLYWIAIVLLGMTGFFLFRKKAPRKPLASSTSKVIHAG